MKTQNETEETQIVPWEAIYENLVDDEKWQDAWREIMWASLDNKIIDAVSIIQNCVYRTTAEIYKDGIELDQLEREHEIA